MTKNPQTKNTLTKSSSYQIPTFYVFQIIFTKKVGVTPVLYNQTPDLMFHCFEQYEFNGNLMEFSATLVKLR